MPAPRLRQLRSVSTTSPRSCRALAVEVLYRPPGRGARSLAKTISSYRDAMKLLLTWFRDAERIPPEKLRLADIDWAPGLRLLDWQAAT